MGIPVPPDVRSVLQRARALAEPDLGGLRPTDPLGWHLTLAFVGLLQHERLEILRTAVTAAVTAYGGPDGARAVPVELRIDGAGRFGSHVLFHAVADRPGGSVARLGGSIQEAVARAGLPVDRRVVQPHLTVARGGRAGRVTSEHVAALQATVPTEPVLRWTPASVALYRAVDRDGPARYEIEASVPLPSPG